MNNTVLYLLSTLFQRGLPFILMPIYTHIMPINDFGFYGTYLAILGIVSIVIGLRPDTYLIKQFNDISSIAFNHVVLSCVILIPISTLTLFPIIIVFIKLTIPGNLDGVFFIAAIAISSSIISALKLINETLLQIEEKVYQYSFFQVLHSILVAAFSVFFLTQVENTWKSRAFSELLVSVFLVFFQWHILSKYLKLIDYNRLKDNIYSSVCFLTPLVFHSLAFVLINIGDRLVIQHFLGSESVAKYTVGYTFGMIVGVCNEALLKAWSPYFYSKVKASNPNEELSVFCFMKKSVVPLLLLGMIIGTIGSYIYPMILPKAYEELGFIIFIVSMAYSFEGMRKLFSGYLFLTNKTKLISMVSILTFLINMIMNFIFIPRFGINGAAISTFGSFLFMSLLTVYLSIDSRRKFLAGC
ncbi:lipopolysaccharide biosynthesis protein [Aeromonas veronii]|uniref:lipopolysaccharide biosynthesis protein n=1 Tax=Aeromonas veronii TaxID=654 RepID=UPI00214DE246|nr:oligosaccharide flippase family protein [Aeromonas veronii]MCR3969144.1 oligosaccharide flippase family protein [Aeromonas veronii]MCR3981623.1 oligosaccharide flippase family protein [Aeromonas veronii]